MKRSINTLAMCTWKRFKHHEAAVLPDLTGQGDSSQGMPQEMDTDRKSLESLRQFRI